MCREIINNIFMFMMLPQRVLLWVWYENLKKLVLCLLIPKVKIQVFWNMAVCHWLHAFRCFGETRIHSSVQNHLPSDTDSHSRRQESLTTLLWQCCKFYNPKGIIWYQHTEKNFWNHTLCGESSSYMPKEVSFLHHTYYKFSWKSTKTS